MIYVLFYVRRRTIKKAQLGNWFQGVSVNCTEILTKKSFRIKYPSQHFLVGLI